MVRAGEPPAYEAYAVRFATLPGCPLANLVKGADPERKIDLAMTLWVLKGPGGRTVLVDAGFYREEILGEPTKRRGGSRFPRGRMRLSSTLRIQARRESRTSSLTLHCTHSDHVDGADLFPGGRQILDPRKRSTLHHYAEKTGRPGGGRPDSEPEYIKALVSLNTLGRVHLVDGDAKEIIPGVTVYTGGKHTFASQYVGVNTKAGTVVIASDNVYTYENLEKHVPIAATLDAKSNLAAQDRMKKIASNPRLIIPSHDPEVFVRFPKPGNGVARLE